MDMNFYPNFFTNGLTHSIPNLAGVAGDRLKRVKNWRRATAAKSQFRPARASTSLPSPPPAILPHAPLAPPPPPHGAPRLLLLQANRAPTPDSPLPPRDLGMEAASEDTDGDRVIEIVSAGALYRGEEWERKYWSNSRVRSLCLTFAPPSLPI
jgi:hypothetical protein